MSISEANIWSFGVVLYEMLTGEKLFGGGETVSLVLADVLRAPIDLSKVPASTPASVKDVLERSLEQNVKNRSGISTKRASLLTRAGKAAPP